MALHFALRYSKGTMLKMRKHLKGGRPHRKPLNRSLFGDFFRSGSIFETRPRSSEWMEGQWKKRMENSWPIRYKEWEWGRICERARGKAL